MMISVKQEDALKTLLGYPENQYCFDCARYEPEFACPLNGIFLCMACANKHREILDPLVSNPRSLYLSAWDGEDLTMMSFGGN